MRSTTNLDWQPLFLPFNDGLGGNPQEVGNLFLADNAQLTYLLCQPRTGGQPGLALPEGGRLRKDPLTYSDGLPGWLLASRSAR